MSIEIPAPSGAPRSEPRRTGIPAPARGSMIRMPTGVPGLDALMDGGVLQGHTLALLGSPGTGKTILALQFLWEGLQRDQRGIYISLDQEDASLIQTAALFGWDLQRYLDRGSLQMVRLDAADLHAALGRIESEIPAILREFGASRVVIDPITIMEMLVHNETERRRRTLELCQWISAAGATTIVTAEASLESPYHSRFGDIEFAADGVVVLHRFQVDGRSQLALEVVKMRHTAHSAEIKPYSISSRGMTVHTDLKVSFKDMQRRG